MDGVRSEVFHKGPVVANEAEVVLVNLETASRMSDLKTEIDPLLSDEPDAVIDSLAGMFIISNISKELGKRLIQVVNESAHGDACEDEEIEYVM